MSLTTPQGSKQALALRLKPKPTGPTGADRELESTLARFQAILTDSDREKLQDLKRFQHDTQAIITFTADLDRLDPKRRGKSVASRLASFLQTIEQFTSIIDTYIQSNPDLTALIWGSIKLTFMLLANITSYFLPFVDLLGGFGTLCARFAEYKLLFADSQRIKDSICEFHSAVILCCERIVVAIRRPLTSQAWNVLTQSFQSEIRSYVEEIRSKAEAVQDEIQLAKMKSDHTEQQRQSKERRAAAEGRSQLSSWLSKSKAELNSLRAQERKRESNRQQHRLLKAVSSYNYTTAFNTARNKRHNGTAEWVFSTDEFRDWYESDQSAVLHITGKIGSGKSILVSRIIEHICQTKQHGQFISFILCQFDDHTSLRADTILRSLVQQMLSTIAINTITPVLYTELMKTLKQAKDNFFPREELQNIYEHASKLSKDWFIVVDGLDECHRDEQQTLYEFFSQLLSESSTPQRIKVLFSCRETTVKDVDRAFPSVSRLFTGSSQTSNDIMVYAKDIIAAKQATKDLVVANVRLIDEILHAIELKEQGMFLWVFLTIEDICCQKSDNAIRNALNDIPADLPAIFDRVLGRIVKNHHQLIARDIFMWTLAVKEPLTLSQLREALSVKVEQESLSKDDLINGIENIAIWCQSLVQVEQADSTVHFSHHSVQEHLLKADKKCVEPFHLEPIKSDDFVAKICLAYLNLSNFKTALVETRNQQSGSSSNMRTLFRGVPRQTIRTAVDRTVGTTVRRFAEQIVGPESRSASSHSENLFLTDLVFVSDSSLQSKSTEHPFFTYAAKNWHCHHLILNTNEDDNQRTHDHVNFNTNNDVRTLTNLDKILLGPHSEVTLPWTNQAWLDSLPRLFFEGGDKLEILDLLFQLQQSRFQEKYLPFAAVYGHISNNPALAHLSITNLATAFANATPTANAQVLELMLRILVRIVNEPCCMTFCLRAVQPLLGHQRLISSAIECIAVGIDSLPAYSEAELDTCDCKMERPATLIHDEVHRLLKVGYKAEDQPFLKSLAALSLGRNSQLSSSETLINWNVESREHGIRPETNRVEALGKRHAMNLTGIGNSIRRDPGFWETPEKSLALKGVFWALERGETAQAKILATIWGMEEGGGGTNQDTAVFLVAIQGAAENLWSTEFASDIVRKYPLQDHNLQEWDFWVESLRHAIRIGRWILAQRLATSVDGVGFWGARLSTSNFNILVDVLRCEKCQVTQESMSPLQPEELKCCEKHVETKCSI
ncbi:hypothetical protein B0J13DRAFT_565659 [Dactylonectria estremocensis]|uniref:NACHT domain-containing protein n=1 Tax=Dactylonectria estremocensis TaxID=1079267 RepID=A0A9P9DUJ8_9HYPO|nr:hypothetical protein B0J13DRAFT_565659 [Dactylonectria estremocensis]